MSTWVRIVVLLGGLLVLLLVLSPRCASARPHGLTLPKLRLHLTVEDSPGLERQAAVRLLFEVAWTLGRSPGRRVPTGFYLDEEPDELRALDDLWLVPPLFPAGYGVSPSYRVENPR